MYSPVQENSEGFRAAVEPARLLSEAFGKQKFNLKIKNLPQRAIYVVSNSSK
jgi:hypothetical protein